jgi:hypothetical protein
MDYNTDIHELITDGTYAVDNYFIRYIKRPEDIVVDTLTPVNQVDSELDDSIHREIVDEAIKIAVSVTKPEEYQIKQAENQQAE